MLEGYAVPHTPILPHPHTASHAGQAPFTAPLSQLTPAPVLISKSVPFVPSYPMSHYPVRRAHRRDMLRRIETIIVSESLCYSTSVVHANSWVS